MTPLNILAVEPTLFFIQSPDHTLQQQALLRVENAGIAVPASWSLAASVAQTPQSLGTLEPGKSEHKIFLPDLAEPAALKFCLWAENALQDALETTWHPQKHWDVHLVHGSHHDLGYTDIPSRILQEHDHYLDQVVQFCAETEDWPAESRFRYVAEQAWSVLHYLEHRPPQAAEKLLQLLREGRIEVNAFLDNETSELCGHEEQIRLVYPAFQLKHRFGVPVRTAELNDIPGISWGLVSVLSGCGIRWFAPAIQDYFAWGGKVHPNWDEQAVLPRDMLGAFWWEGPDGSRVLFWHGGDKIEGPWLWNYSQSERDLPAYLNSLSQHGYPYDLVRLKFLGGKRDNAPPDLRLSQIVREWNSRWAYPHLVISTNAAFFERFERAEGHNLPVLRGDLPNTDYPIGATSHARELGINRLTHDLLASAEKMAACAAMVRVESSPNTSDSDSPYPADQIAEAYDCTLLYDGHVGGMAHPVGPAQEAAWGQKNEWAYRAAALAHDILVKSTNCIADQILLEDEGYHLIVFNPLAHVRTDLVRLASAPPAPASMPLYWRDPPAGEMDYRERVPGTTFGRPITNLPPEILEQPFEILDQSTGQRVPYQVLTLEDPLAARPWAAHRWALGQVEQHPSIFPFHIRGHLLELVFIAENVPPVGYKVFRLIPSNQPPVKGDSLQSGTNWLENRFYRIELDAASGAVSSLYDKTLGREWIDRMSPHGFNQLLVRSPITGEVSYPGRVQIKSGEHGPVMASLIVKSDAPGCPQITQEITLYSGLKRIDFANRLLKDATPLLELYFAFPFAIPHPHFRYEASNATIEPIRDQLPGSNTDAYTMQHWVSAWDDQGGITWTSLEAPVMEVGGLWPGYVSQAHHGITPPGYGHEFLREPAQWENGHIYSYIMNNNFRTNFDPVQVADVLFRYSLTSHAGEWQATPACTFGWEAATPLETVCLKGPQTGYLAAGESFCELDRANLILLTLKLAEDGNGMILRLFETDGQDCRVTLRLPHFTIQKAFLTNLVEENLQELDLEPGLPAKQHIRVPVRANSLTTLRLVGAWEKFPLNEHLAHF